MKKATVYLIFLSVGFFPAKASAEVIGRVGFSPLTGYIGIEFKTDFFSCSFGYFGTQTGFDQEMIYGIQEAQSYAVLCFGTSLYMKGNGNSPFAAFSVNKNSNVAYNYDARTYKETVEWADMYAAFAGYHFVIGKKLDIKAGAGAAWVIYNKLATMSSIAFAWEAVLGYTF